MHHMPTLEHLDLELLAAIQREWQTEMRHEARQAYLLGDHATSGKGNPAVLKRKLVLALVAVTLMILWLAYLALAA